jgi:FK506-binding protein 2
MACFKIVAVCVLAVIVCAAVASADDKVTIEVIKEGVAGCRKAKNGDELKMHYDGSLADGTPFDSSYKRGNPLPFTLGASQVIKGWEQGSLG